MLIGFYSAVNSQLMAESKAQKWKILVSLFLSNEFMSFRSDSIFRFYDCESANGSKSATCSNYFFFIMIYNIHLLFERTLLCQEYYHQYFTSKKIKANAKTVTIFRNNSQKKRQSNKQNNNSFIDWWYCQLFIVKHVLLTFQFASILIFTESLVSKIITF